jgi:glycosyltransferase involved in cell wall biosynthesis
LRALSNLIITGINSNDLLYGNVHTSDMEFSVVIPLFNEEETLPLLHEKLHTVCESISKDYEIIYVDDGSTDSSPEILEGLKNDYPTVRVVSFKQNRGQSAGLYAGFKESRGTWIITLDADLQNPPEEILKLWKSRDGFDFITGIREKRKDSLLRIISSRIAKYFRWLTLGDTTQDIGCSLRIFKREIVDRLPYFRNFHRFFTLLTREAGFRIKEIPLKHHVRQFGESKYTTFQRAREGIFDLIGVFWLKRRLIQYEIKDQ